MVWSDDPKRPKVYKSKSALDVHVKAQHKKAQYKCNLCDRTYKYKHKLKSHQNTHNIPKQRQTKPYDQLSKGQTFKRNYKEVSEIEKQIKQYPEG